MINGQKVLAIIPARGGSKGVPRKNVRMVAGKPLIAWTIEAARQSRYIDRLVLSSDDPEIIAVATAHGCEAPFVRPAELARDETPGIDPVLHALQQLPGYDWVVLLQPTSPLRSGEDIDATIETCVKAVAPAAVSVTEAEESPWWMYTLQPGDQLQPLLDSVHAALRRQDLPKAYLLNGAVYVAQATWLQQHKSFLGDATRAYVMPRARSLDIDTEFDLKLFDMMAGADHGNDQETH